MGIDLFITTEQKSLSQGADIRAGKSIFNGKEELV